MKAHEVNSPNSTPNTQKGGNLVVVEKQHGQVQELKMGYLKK
jgi:hypothetical protein